MKITKSEIVNANTADALFKFAKNKPKIERVYEMDEKLGIEALKVMSHSISNISVNAIKTFGDGLQLSDISFIPSAVPDIIAIKNNAHQSVLEIKDLSFEEFQVIFGHVIKDLYDAYTAVKNQLNSGD